MKVWYRKDIDGLRAIAMLLVVLFHVYPRLITGGFIGVDVFFVISGFLITGLIASGLRDGTFSLSEFYGRRIRRIFPALALVLAACLLVGWLVLLPADYGNLGKHIAASAGFIANFTLWSDAGYFDSPSELKPVLHLWSLGIEEQFYLLWPLLMIVTWRWRRATIITASGICAASFVWNVLTTRSDPAAAFFLPAGRFWELMVGCLLALALPSAISHEPTPGGQRGGAIIMRDGASLVGSLLILVGVIAVSGGQAFPGWGALPTAGAALLIGAGPGALVNRLLLSRSAFVRLGLISYPLYLWHWPILAFMRYYTLRPTTDLMRWGGVAVALLLADLTYRFIEQPIRRGAPSALKSSGAAVAVAMIGCMGLAVFAGGGFKTRFPQQLAAVVDTDREKHRFFWGLGLCAGSDGIQFTADCRRPAGSRLIAVWGDSHAAGLVAGLVEAERSRSDIRVAIFTFPSCPPTFMIDQSLPVPPMCLSHNRATIEKIGSMKADTVILAGNWLRDDGVTNGALVDQRSVLDLADRLRAAGVRHIVGVGQFPLWVHGIPRILARQYIDHRASAATAAAREPMRSLEYVDPQSFASDERMRRWFSRAGAAFVSPPSILCNQAGCLMTVPERLDPMDWDGEHLTRAGSIWFVTQALGGLFGGH